MSQKPTSHARQPIAAPSAPSGFLVRVNKALADAGVCSRRKADELVAQGRVTCNGLVVDSPGCRVDVARDHLCVDGAPVGQRQGLYHVLLNKPIHAVSTVSDPQGRTTVLDFLPQELAGSRLYPVGRLDYFSEGLLLLTNDGELAQRMTHPRHHLPKVYHVLVRGNVPDSALHAMREGMTLAEGERLAPVEVERVEGRGKQRGNATTLLRLTLHQGVNRQIRRMCRDLGLTILRLTRTRQGPLCLKGLEPGQCRPLTPEEVRELRAALGLRATCRG